MRLRAPVAMRAFTSSRRLRIKAAAARHRLLLAVVVLRPGEDAAVAEVEQLVLLRERQAAGRGHHVDLREVVLHLVLHRPVALQEGRGESRQTDLEAAGVGVRVLVVAEQAQLGEDGGLLLGQLRVAHAGIGHLEDLVVLPVQEAQQQQEERRREARREEEAVADVHRVQEVAPLLSALAACVAVLVAIVFLFFFFRRWRTASPSLQRRPRRRPRPIGRSAVERTVPPALRYTRAGDACRRRRRSGGSSSPGCSRTGRAVAGTSTGTRRCARCAGRWRGGCRDQRPQRRRRPRLQHEPFVLDALEAHADADDFFDAKLEVEARELEQVHGQVGGLHGRVVVAVLPEGHRAVGARVHHSPGEAVRKVVEPRDEAP